MKVRILDLPRWTPWVTISEDKVQEFVGIISLPKPKIQNLTYPKV